MLPKIENSREPALVKPEPLECCVARPGLHRSMSPRRRSKHCQFHAVEEVLIAFKLGLETALQSARSGSVRFGLPGNDRALLDLACLPHDAVC